MVTPTKHAVYGPSSSHRWTKCTASLNCNLPQTTSPAAEMGTVAHKFNEQCIETGMSPDAFLGSRLDGHEIDFEMVEGAKLYIETICNFIRQFPDAVVVYEKYLTSQLDVEFAGTVDCLIKAPGVTIVIDYKYGLNPVEVDHNTQLMSYLYMSADPGDRMIACIVQPRWNHPHGRVRTWEPSDLTMEHFVREVSRAIESHRAGQEIFHIGDHCKYCRRMLNCPAMNAKVSELHDTAGGDLTFMTNEQAAAVLKISKAVIGYFEEVENFAVAQLESGATVPGYKIVEKYGRRKWSVDADAIYSAARSKGVGKKLLQDKSLKSPSQIEKIMGKDFVSKFSTVESSGTTLVPSTDKREGLDLQSTRKEFQSRE